jgi:hypothetical protein
LGVVALSVGLSLAGRALLGPRGQLVPSVLVGAYPTFVAAFIAGRWLRGSRDARLISRNRGIVTAMAVLPSPSRSSSAGRPRSWRSIWCPRSRGRR